MKKWFPEPNDAAALQSFRTVTIQRHQSSSVFCGFYDGLLGRVIFNLCGHRFIMGMRFDSWLQNSKAFVKWFILVILHFISGFPISRGSDRVILFSV